MKRFLMFVIVFVLALTRLRSQGRVARRCRPEGLGWNRFEGIHGG